MFALIATLFLPVLAAEQQAIVVRQATVYANASSTAQTVGQVGAGTRVSIFSRKGGWKEIFSEEQAVIGWVRSYQVREGDFAPATEIQTTADSRGFLSGLAALSRKASSFFKSESGSTSSGTATIGVRGLSEDQIKSAVADPAELEKMNQFASNQQRIDGFVRQGKLSPVKIPHFEN